MLTESGSGTLAGGAHSDAWKQFGAGDAVVVSESCLRDFDRLRLEAAFPGWPVEAGFKLITDEPGPYDTLLAQSVPAGQPASPLSLPA